MSIFNKPIVWITSGIGTVVGGIIYLKEFGQGVRYHGKESLSGRVAIVTGANTGIGLETVKDFAKRDARIIMACRDLSRCHKARSKVIQHTGNRNITCSELDLRSFNSIKEFSKRVQNAEKKIDILVNNAAVMRIPDRRLTQDGLEVQMGVNHFGHFLLSNLLLDLLKKSDYPARIINVSSVAHIKGMMNWEDLNSEKGYDPSKAYEQSKLANILFTKELARRLKNNCAVTVNAVHPGIVNTEIFRYMSFYQSTFSTLFIYPFSWLFMKTPRLGAQTVIHVAVDPSLKGVSGKYFSNCKEIDPSPQAENEDFAKRLWLISEKWTKLPEAQHDLKLHSNKENS